MNPYQFYALRRTFSLMSIKHNKSGCKGRFMNILRTSKKNYNDTLLHIQPKVCRLIGSKNLLAIKVPSALKPMAKRPRSDGTLQEKRIDPTKSQLLFCLSSCRRGKARLNPVWRKYQTDT
jgi:hypothetical protein